jgi:flagellar protein FliJ
MYKFALEKVLEIRKNLEEKKQSELGLMEKKLNDENRRLNELKKDRDKLSNEIQTKINKGISSPEIILYSNYINKINHDIQLQYHKINDFEKMRDDKRQELIIALKNRKSLENIKVKRSYEYLKKEKKIETNQLDEFGSNQFIRRTDNIRWKSIRK